ncbi:DMT family transporter [Aestuariivirga sp.]|uniref:DMT family transporter n=1 Tax=Aestuariivirga sp. TaxID=2650926 RepID=UPI0035930935
MSSASIFRNRSLAGVLSLCLGVMIFSLQDAILKGVSGDHAVTLAIFIRCMVSIPILLVMLQIGPGLSRLASRNLGVLLSRGLILLVAYTTYYMALPALPLAEAIALFFVAPILVTIMAGPLLAEMVPMRSWLAVIAGFIGVLIILQPGSALFEPAALLSLISAATYGFSMILARKFGAEEPATVMAFYQNVVFLAGAGLLALTFSSLGITSFGHPSLDFLVRPWALPGLGDILLMGACGVIAAVATWLLTQAYQMAQANLVTVFEYTGMIWGPLWGFLFFAEIPKVSTAIGTIIIIAAGIYAVRTGRS